MTTFTTRLHWRPGDAAQVAELEDEDEYLSIATDERHMDRWVLTWHAPDNHEGVPLHVSDSVDALKAWAEAWAE